METRSRVTAVSTAGLNRFKSVRGRVVKQWDSHRVMLRASFTAPGSWGIGWYRMIVASRWVSILLRGLRRPGHCSFQNGLWVEGEVGPSGRYRTLNCPICNLIWKHYNLQVHIIIILLQRRRTRPRKNHLIYNFVLLRSFVCPNRLAKVRDIINTESPVKSNSAITRIRTNNFRSITN